MSTITLPNIRVSSDLTVKVRLKDGGVAIDWSTLSSIRALIYSDAQKAMAGRCVVTVDAEDATLLVCQYAATKPQYIGVNRIVISATYMNEMKTYDKPALNFVRWTDDQAGEQITIDDPDVEVEIEVEDVSSSILQEAVDAAFSAAERADEAAAAAEHMVDIHQGPPGEDGKSPYIGENGHWYEWDEDAGEYVDTETEAQGETGTTPDITIGTVTTVEPGTPAAATMTGTPEAPVLNLTIPKGVAGDTPAFTVGEVTTGQPGTPVVVTITGTAAAPVLNIQIPQGLQGNPGSSVDYPFELVNNATTNDATKAATAAVAKGLKDDITQLEAEVDENREELDSINLKVTGRIGVANGNADIDPEDLPEYTGQYGQVTLTVSGDAYLWVCLENESFRLTANGIDIPMVYVKEDGGLHCFVSAEKIKAGTLVFDITNLHPIKADGERVVITARSYTITYGDAMPDFGYIADGQVEGTPAITCEAVQGSDAGTYAINIARGTVVDDNCIYVPGVLTIEKAELTVTAEDKQVAVGGAMPAFTVQYSGFVLGEDASDLTTVPTCTTTAEDTSTDGNYPITPAGGVATNYSFAYVPGILTVGEPVILTLDRAEMFASGSCGGYIDATSPYKFLTSTQYVGIIIDVQRYRGMKVTVTKGSNAVARFAILKTKTLTNNTAPTFSTATGFTGLISHSWGTNETEFEFTIPSDAAVMYVYTYNSSYPNTPMCHTMEIHGVPQPAVMKNLTADLFATNTTIGNDGTVYTGAANAPTTVCSDYLNTNNYCRLGVASFIKNNIPIGVDEISVNIAEYDPNKLFIKRESFHTIPREYTLAPSCKFIRVIVVCVDANGDNMSGDVVRFDGDDIQIVGLENL